MSKPCRFPGRRSFSTRQVLRTAVLAATPAVAATLCLAPATAWAANSHWDLNGATAGATDDAGGIASGTWDNATANWSAATAGDAATAIWVAGDTPVFSAGTNATGASSITVVGTQTANGITTQEGTLSFIGDQITLTGNAVAITAATSINNVIGGTVGLTKSGAGALTLNATNLYTGGTTLSAGTLNLGVATAIPAGTLTLSGGTLANSSGAAMTLANNNPITTTANFTYNGPHDLNTGAGAVTLNVATTTVTVGAAGGAFIIGGNIANGSGTALTKAGAGNLVLSGTNSFTGNTAVNGGTLTLDFTTNNTNKISGTGVLTLGAGTLSVIGANGAGPGTSQAVLSTTLSANTGSNVTVAKGDTQNATLALGAITRGAAAVVNFNTTGVGAGAAAITTTNTNASSILGAYATFGGTDWAVVNAGSIATLGTYAANDFATPANDVDVTADASPAGPDVTVNSVRFNTPAAVTATLTGNANVISSGGILAGTGIGANAAALNGGSITSGGAEMVVQVHNTAADFSIGSNVVGTGVALTKGGAGTLVLNGDNANTGAYNVVAGTLKLGTGERITNTSAVAISAGAVFDVAGQAETIGALTGSGQVNLSEGNLTFGQAANASFAGTIISGGMITKTGSNTQTLGGTGSTYNGRFVINGGVLAFPGESSSAAGAGNALGQNPAGGPVTDYITLDGGTLRNTTNSSAGTASFLFANRGITIGANGGTLDVSNAAARIVYAGKINGTAKWTKTGAGQLALTNTANPFENGFKVVQGTLVHSTFEGAADVFPTMRASGLAPSDVVPDYVILDGGTMKYNNSGAGSTFLSTRKGITLGAAGGGVAIDGTAGNLNATGITQYLGKVSAAAGTTPTLFKRGTGEFRANKATAGDTWFPWEQVQTVVEEGFFRIGNLGQDTGFGAVPASYDADAILLNGTSAGIRDTGAVAIGTTAIITTPATRGITMNANGGTLITSLGVDGGGNPNAWTIQSIITGGSAASALHINGNGFPITGAGAFETQTSALVLTGANTYLGATRINVATLVAQGGAAIPDGSAVVIDPAATRIANLRVDANETIGSLAGGNASFGIVQLNNASLTMGADNTSTTYDGLIVNGAAGSGGISKTGTGTQTLTRANTYTGATAANGGTLLLTQPLTTSSAVNVSGTGTVAMVANGTSNNFIRTPVLTASDSGRIDIRDNKIITSAAAGTWNGVGAYTGVAGLVDSGRGAAGNATWNGSGIVTSDTRAIGTSDLASIGVVDASDKFRDGLGAPIAETATALFAGQTVTGADTLVMFTYGGDANLDGKLNIDDYGQIDSNVSKSGTVFGWNLGDFNYDGKINIDDYGIIDGNIGRQSGTFPTAGTTAGGGAPLDGVAAVPEPTGLALVALGALAFTRRQRRPAAPQT